MNSLVLSINQPAYLPWLGYFQRIAASDLHIVLDNVQFEKNSFTNRNRIRTAQGSCWLTVPVITKGRFGQPIDQVMIDNRQPWTHKHWESLRAHYGKAPFFARYAPFFRALYQAQWTSLEKLCGVTTHFLLEALGIDTPVIYASDLKVGGEKQQRLINLCNRFDADVYLSGSLGRDYIELQDFARAGIEVYFQEYQHPSYAQSQPGFVPYMSIIDLVFNHGPESRHILENKEADHVVPGYCRTP